MLRRANRIPLCQLIQNGTSSPPRNQLPTLLKTLERYYGTHQIRNWKQRQHPVWKLQTNINHLTALRRLHASFTRMWLPLTNRTKRMTRTTPQRMLLSHLVSPNSQYYVVLQKKLEQTVWQAWSHGNTSASTGEHSIRKPQVCQHLVLRSHSLAAPSNRSWTVQEGTPRSPHRKA